jgi:hypothetical protein
MAVVINVQLLSAQKMHRSSCTIDVCMRPMPIVNLYTKIAVNHSRNSRGWDQARGGGGGGLSQGVKVT